MSNEREVFFIEQIIYYLKEKFKEISKRFQRDFAKKSKRLLL